MLIHISFAASSWNCSVYANLNHKIVGYICLEGCKYRREDEIVHTVFLMRDLWRPGYVPEITQQK
jgi:hypothetical protein